jgi:8-oxo-dGTP pyrophosphatase MutT (NUDIX family)
VYLFLPHLLVPAPPNPHQVVKAAGILLICTATEPPEFLLMRHPRRWDLPKGHCELGESFQQTALRETEEETGIAATLISVDETFHFDLQYQVTYKRWGDQRIQKQVRYFLGYLRTKPVLKLTEHDSAHWFPWQPPHRIQSETIDPLLAAVAHHVNGNPRGSVAWQT